MDESILDGTLDDVAPLGSRYHVTAHSEPNGLWAEVAELPGCFASGTDTADLKEAVAEAIELYTSTRAHRNHIGRMSWRRTGDGRYSVTLTQRASASVPPSTQQPRLRVASARR